MLRAKDLIFDNANLKLANKVAKLLKDDVENVELANEDNLYVKVIFSTYISQNGVYAMDKFIGIEVEQHKTMPLCNCMSYDDMKYEDWVGDNIWGKRKSAPLELELFYKFSEFTKKKMNEDFKKSAIIIDTWIKECHEEKQMVMKYFRKEEYIGDDK